MSFIVDNFSLFTGKVDHIEELKLVTLDLAFRGKLVSQASIDKPATELLKEIKSERANLVKAGEIRKGKSLKPISEDERPYQLPKNWTWCRLGDIIELISGQHIVNSEYNEIGQGVPYLTGPSDFGERNPIFSKWTEKPKVLAMKGDILITVKGSGVGKVNVLHKNDVAIGRQLMAIRKILLPEEFLLLFLRTKYHQLQAVKVGIAIPGIGREDILNMKFPLPPLPEQHRIVQKVTALFQQIDRLAEASERAEAVRGRLRRVWLRGLEEASTPLEAARAWRPLQDHFDLAIRTVEDVRALRGTILQLAVRGRLVAQDAGEEPASVLLERIKEEKKLPAILEDEIPFKVPDGWVWCRGELVSDYIDPHPSHRTPSEVPGGVPYIGMKDIDLEGNIRFHTARKVSQKVFSEHKERYQLQKGDFIFGKIGTLGKPVLLSEPFDYVLSANIILIQPNRAVINETYLFHYLSSETVNNILRSRSNTTTHAAFGIKKARLLPIPLPPLAEQRRIVAKVAQLLEWCDELEKQIREKEEKQDRLVQASIVIN